MANINQIQLPDGSNYNLKDNVSGYASETYVDNAVAAIDKTSVGLGNVDNTSDANKPISTAQQTVLNAKANNSTIAPVEASTTASRRYEIGEQFILSGVLYTATAIIANGGTITVGTNCTASDTLIEQIENVSPSAGNVSFDNTGTDLVSEEVESAIKEVNGKYNHLMKLAWTNPSPSSSMSPQTISLDSSLAGFTFALVVLGGYVAHVVPIGQRTALNDVGYYNGVLYFGRVFTINETSFTVEAGAQNGDTQNSRQVPIAIYGLN
jgi:hypothetical protein